MRLCDHIRSHALAAHRFLRHGHLEKVYENSLSNRLRKSGFSVVTQHPLPVYDEDGSLLGDFIADLVVENQLIVELKAVSHLTDDHTAQILGYLRSARLRHGLLINFGSARIQIKKFVGDLGYTNTGVDLP